jgi:D-alanyl-lipoteichoic acid acyltransferase DltB (MBOAT superfamily)
MLVSSASFYLFLAAVCLLYWLTIPLRRLQTWVLLLANLFFLARFSLVYLALPLAAAADFFIGLGLARCRKQGTKRSLLSLSLLLNLGILIGLKILPLATGSHWQWLLPLTLSFYCFQSLTYTIELYYGEIQPARNLGCYLQAALFFPAMTAGPIPRMGDLLRQFQRGFELNAERSARALLLISTGLVKKLLIADYLSNNLVDRVFDTPALYSSGEILLGVYGYALQLFFDFSGYTDIARGAALLLGIELPENFNRPYLATNLSEFWNRWHISFSRWLFSYLYDVFPKWRRLPRLSYGYAVLLTMLLGGLWHGISWNFLLWGALHGVALGLVFLWKYKRKQGGFLASRWAKTLAGLLTFHYVCFTWIFFRAANLEGASAILHGLARLSFTVENITPMVAVAMLLAAMAHCLPATWFERSVRVLARVPFWAQGLALAGLILLIQTLAGRGSAPFVYGNF